MTEGAVKTWRIQKTHTKSEVFYVDAETEDAAVELVRAIRSTSRVTSPAVPLQEGLKRISCEEYDKYDSMGNA